MMRRAAVRLIPEGLGLSRPIITAADGIFIPSCSTSDRQPADCTTSHGKHAWVSHTVHVPFAASTPPFASGARSISSSAAASSAGGGLSPLEAVSMVLSPSQLGAQLWEAGHAMTGLPWWASIPATTIAVRALLAPLSAKARSGSVNWLLLDTAFVQARVLASALQPGEARELGRLRLVRAISAALRARHGTGSWRWYTVNTAVQGALFLSLSRALSVMSAALWPGLTEQGALYFPDLTAPPVYPAHLSTPYGTMGAVLPLLITLLYLRALEGSLAARAPGLGTAARVVVIPLYCVAVVQPHAVLLYWLTQVATHSALAAILPQSPVAAKLMAAQAAGTPPAAAASSSAAGSATPEASSSSSAGAEAGAVPVDGQASSSAQQYGPDGLVAGANILGDVDLLTQVGRQLMARGAPAGAEVCLRRALQAAPEAAGPDQWGAALASLGEVLGRQGKWQEAVETLLRAGRTPGASPELRVRALLQAVQRGQAWAAASASGATEGKEAASQALDKAHEAAAAASEAVREVQDEQTRSQLDTQLSTLLNMFSQR